MELKDLILAAIDQKIDDDDLTLASNSFVSYCEIENCSNLGYGYVRVTNHGSIIKPLCENHWNTVKEVIKAVEGKIK